MYIIFVLFKYVGFPTDSREAHKAGGLLVNVGEHLGLGVPGDIMSDLQVSKCTCDTTKIKL